MPEFSLSEYSVRIADQIEKGRLDEAIAHCRHLLAHYPRYLSAYKLLARICLEQGDFAHANHFSQCVLSANLEDTDAWINLGQLAEDLGETEQAIWFLERAFEVAPGHTQVRERLRQLYTQRDGSERPRIRLTPAALARLYAKGGFYRRAVRQLKKLLSGSADMHRLQIAALETVLAKALWHQEDQASEAAQVCESLLQKLAFSLQANLILGDIRASAGRHQEAEPYLQRARSLDPEGELAQKLLGHKSPLPVQSIQIPYLEYEVPPVEQAQPVGAQAEDVSWLDRIGQSLEPLELEDDQEAPDWIRDWTEKETPMPTTIDDESTSADNAEAGRQDVPLGGEPARDTELEVPDWLLAIQQESAVPGTEEEPPDWLADLSEDAAPGKELASLSEDQLPDWLDELEPEQVEEPSTEPAEPSALEGDLPDWLIELSQEPEAETPAAPGEELLDETPVQEAGMQAQAEPEKSTRPLHVPVEPEQVAPVEQQETEPEWFDELRQEAETSTVIEPAPEALVASAPALPDEGSTPAETREESLSDLATDELPNWLRELEAEIGDLERPDREVQMATPEAQTERSQVPVSPPPVRADETIAPEPAVTEEPPEIEQPDWLPELDKAALSEAVPEVVAAPEDEGEELDWLYELEEDVEEEEALFPAFEQDMEIEEDELEDELEPMLDDELPDWLRELRAEPGFAEAVALTGQEAELAPEKDSTLEPMEDDELPGWLQELRPAGEPQPVEAAPPVTEIEPEVAVEPLQPEVEQIAEPISDLSDEMEELEWLRELEQTAAIEAPVSPPDVQAPEPALAVEGPPLVRDEAPPVVASEAPPEPAVAESEPAKEAVLPQAEDTESRLSLARASLSRRALDESAKEYERLVVDPDLAAELVEELEQAVQEHSEHHALQRVLGDAYMRTGQLDKALDAYRQALSKL